MTSGTRELLTWLVEDMRQSEEGTFCYTKMNRSVLAKETKSGQEIDGSSRLVTDRSDWHTHLAMVLNRSMGEELPSWSGLNHPFSR